MNLDLAARDDGLALRGWCVVGCGWFRGSLESVF